MCCKEIEKGNPTFPGDPDPTFLEIHWACKQRLFAALRVPTSGLWQIPILQQPLGLLELMLA